MANKSIIIIGAGIAGLSVGCYAQMNGYHSKIFELHSLPGGLCTSWGHKGYTFDGCIHWLVGSGEGGLFNNVWKELGAFQHCQFVNHDDFVQVEGRGGKKFILYANLDRLEQHILELSPGDATLIRKFIKDTRRLANFSIPIDKPREVVKPLEALRMIPSMLPMMGLTRKYAHMPIQSFTALFKDPFLSDAIQQLFDLRDFPTLAMMMTLGYLDKQNAGYPIGGSLKFSQAIEKRYLNLGGEIHYKLRVAKILVENHNAVGVRLIDGTEQRADIVISAADGHATLFDMLDGNYLNDEIRGYYETMPIFQPIIQVSLGIACDLSDQPHMVSIPLEPPISIAGVKREHFQVRHLCFDPTLAPPGKSVVQTMFVSNYAYWKELADDPERYEAEKKQIALAVITQLDKRIPGLEEQVEVVDVATPLTFERYTGNWQGSMEGWRITTKTIDSNLSGKGMSKTLPGLENFYMIGQWVEPGGGVPTAAMSGRNVIQIICKRDGTQFVTELPS